MPKTQQLKRRSREDHIRLRLPRVQQAIATYREILEREELSEATRAAYEKTIVELGGERDLLDAEWRMRTGKEWGHGE